jgi:hypothetical protein
MLPYLLDSERFVSRRAGTHPQMHGFAAIESILVA